MNRTRHSAVLNRHYFPIEYCARSPPGKTGLERMEDHANLSRAALFSQVGFGGLIGESAPMHHLYGLIGKVSQSNSPVLLLGETGTGKELVARAIHFTGLRSEKALVPVDCSGLTPTLVESDLL